MVRLIKALLFLGVLGFLALVGYAYLGNMSPSPEQVTEPVILDAG